jgi:hypothetical protein
MLHLSFGAAMAADTTEVQQAQLTAANTQEPQKPKEETTSPPQSTTATKEEPDCNN